jgi:hypothetical protein
MKRDYKSEYSEITHVSKNSDTQETRVGTIETDEGEKIALQKFWRKDNTSSYWNLGKGFQFDCETAENVAYAILGAVALVKNKVN